MRRAERGKPHSIYCLLLTSGTGWAWEYCFWISTDRNSMCISCGRGSSFPDVRFRTCLRDAVSWCSHQSILPAAAWASIRVLGNSYRESAVIVFTNLFVFWKGGIAPVLFFARKILRYLPEIPGCHGVTNKSRTCRDCSWSDSWTMFWWMLLFVNVGKFLLWPGIHFRQKYASQKVCPLQFLDELSTYNLNLWHKAQCVIYLLLDFLSYTVIEFVKFICPS